MSTIKANIEKRRISLTRKVESTGTKVVQSGQSSYLLSVWAVDRIVWQTVMDQITTRNSWNLGILRVFLHSYTFATDVQ